jgi:prepilin-type N-terminal cleavage/methylation domain-containing protein
MLARLHKRMNKEDEGFTLIELLVVIIIIGILAAIAIPVFLSQKSKGYEASMKSDLRTVAQDIEAQNVDLQNYSNVTFGTGKTLGTPPAAPGITSGAPVGTETAVPLSAGNSIMVNKVVASGGFCLVATSTKTTAKWYYGSENGGISSTDCTSTTT